jgi:hypothetical protein
MRDVGWLLVLVGGGLMLLPFISPVHAVLAFALGLGPVPAFLIFGVGLIILAIRRPERGWRRPCPFCGEQIRPEAVLCLHCRSQVPQETGRARWDAYKARYREYVKTHRR